VILVYFNIEYLDSNFRLEFVAEHSFEEVLIIVVMEVSMVIIKFVQGLVKLVVDVWEVMLVFITTLWFVVVYLPMEYSMDLNVAKFSEVVSMIVYSLPLQQQLMLTLTLVPMLMLLLKLLINFWLQAFWVLTA
jgi:hypothetical protein